MNRSALPLVRGRANVLDAQTARQLGKATRPIGRTVVRHHRSRARKPQRVIGLLELHAQTLVITVPPARRRKRWWPSWLASIWLTPTRAWSSIATALQRQLASGIRHQARHAPPCSATPIGMGARAFAAVVKETTVVRFACMHAPCPSQGKSKLGPKRGAAGPALAGWAAGAASTGRRRRAARLGAVARAVFKQMPEKLDAEYGIPQSDGLIQIFIAMPRCPGRAVRARALAQLLSTAWGECRPESRRPHVGLLTVGDACLGLMRALTASGTARQSANANRAKYACITV